MFPDGQGKPDKAGPLLKRALDIQEKVLGPEHPAVAAFLNNMAGFLDGQVSKDHQHRSLTVRGGWFGFCCKYITQSTFC